MKTRIVLKDEIQSLPDEKGWHGQTVTESGVVISLDARETQNGGVYLTESKLFNLLRLIDLKEQSR
jgi:hypothetical protein